MIGCGFIYAYEGRVTHWQSLLDSPNIMPGMLMSKILAYESEVRIKEKEVFKQHKHPEILIRYFRQIYFHILNGRLLADSIHDSNTSKDLHKYIQSVPQQYLNFLLMDNKPFPQTQVDLDQALTNQNSHCMLALRIFFEALDEKSTMSPHLYLTVLLDKAFVKFFAVKLRDTMEKICQKRFSYNPSQDELYPLRDKYGRPIKIERISALSLCKSRALKSKCPAAAMKPFIRFNCTPNERAQLYRQTVEIRPIVETDLSSRGIGRVMLGRLGAFVKEDIAAGTCLGPYGGFLGMPSVCFVQSSEQKTYSEKVFCQDTSTFAYQWEDALFTYVTGDDFFARLKYKGLGDNSNLKGSFIIDGDSRLSHANTVWIAKQNSEGTFSFVQGGPDCYNAELILFEIDVTLGGEKVRLEYPFLFSTRLVRKGEQILWDYGYSEGVVVNKMKEANEACAARSRAS